MNNNEQYLYILKEQFINLKNFTYSNNYLIYSKEQNLDQCFLGKLDLKTLDNSLFLLTSQEIMYILKNISNMINSPGELDKKILYAETILGLDCMEKKHAEYIYNYLNDFYLRKNMHNKFSYDGDKAEIDKLAAPIHKSYDNNIEIYHNPGSEYIRTLEAEYYDNLLETENGDSSEKEYVRQLKSAHNVVDIKEGTLTSQVNGFMSATFIISIVAIIGIVISVILVALNN